jgi:hypothetical protein
VSPTPAEPRVLTLRAIAAAADRHARLGHAGDWRAPGGCDCLVKVQPIVSTVGATFVQEHLGWLQAVDDSGEGSPGDRRRAALTLGALTAGQGRVAVSLNGRPIAVW